MKYMVKTIDFGKLSLYLEEIMSYKNVKIILHKELHSEYIDVYSEFGDLDDYRDWFLKKKRIENINKII
jgi:hypothetical protein